MFTGWIPTNKLLSTLFFKTNILIHLPDNYSLLQSVTNREKVKAIWKIRRNPPKANISVGSRGHYCQGTTVAVGFC
jgi:hypothetical protein